MYVVPATPDYTPPDVDTRDAAAERIRQLLKERNATIVAHYYTNPELQWLAEETGGFIGDSLAMADYGYRCDEQTLVIVGVKFMGESAKILSPNKTVLMPTLKATCSLDLGCPIDKFSAFCDQHPNRTVVVYCNTSAAVKARADWVVTSTNALSIVDHLDSEGHKILYAPDKHLGSYIQQQTGADMVLWDGACVVHEEFKAQAMVALKEQYPDAAVLVHPESPAEVVAMADVVGSTSRLLQAARELPNDTCIVATDKGIFYKMQQVAPGKRFIEAPTAGQGATCRSCAHCPWMAMNSLDNLERSLRDISNEIVLDAEVIDKARLPLERMLTFKK